MITLEWFDAQVFKSEEKIEIERRKAHCNEREIATEQRIYIGKSPLSRMFSFRVRPFKFVPCQTLPSPKF